MVKLRHSLRYLVPFALYFLVAVIITYPLITVLESRLLGHPFGDAAEYVRHIWWIKYALQIGQPIFDQPLLLYPRGLSGSWLWGAPLQSFPAWLFAFVMPLPAAFNLSALLTLALNGTGMYALAKHLLTTENITPPPTPPRIQGGEKADSPLPARVGEGTGVRGMAKSAEDESSVLLFSSFLAGLVFMLYPAMQGHLGAAHTGLLVQWGAPLLLLALLRVGESRRWMIAGALLFPVALWGSLLLLIYLVTPILAVYGLTLLRAPGGWRSVRLRRTVITLLIGGVIALPFLLPTLRETVGATESGAVRYSSALLGIAAPSFNHPLFSGLEYARQILGADPFESAAYAGVIVVALALIGVITRRAARWWLIVAAGAWLLSLGALLKLTDAPITLTVGGYATTIPLPGLLMSYLPGLSAARTPGRFNFTVGFALAIMAAYGAQSIARRITPPFIRALILVVIGGLIAFEYQFWFPVPTVTADIPAPIAALADRDDIRAVFDVPFEHPLVDKEGLYLQTAHHQPMIGGHVTRQTPLSPAKGWLLQTFDPALLDLLGADVIILHREWDDAEGVLEARLRDQFGAPTYEDERYALFDLPPYTGDAPGFTAISRVPETLTDSASLYFYLPAPGEVILTGQLSGDGVNARLTLDGDRLVTWTVSGRQGWNLPVQVRAPGWHTLTLALDPPCATPNDPTLVCRALSIHHIDLTDYRPVRSP